MGKTCPFDKSSCTGGPGKGGPHHARKNVGEGRHPSAAEEIFRRGQGACGAADSGTGIPPAGCRPGTVPSVRAGDREGIAVADPLFRPLRFEQKDGVAGRKGCPVGRSSASPLAPGPGPGSPPGPAVKPGGHGPPEAAHTRRRSPEPGRCRGTGSGHRSPWSSGTRRI